MSVHPVRKFILNQVVAANTDLGKTLFSAALCRAAARNNCAEVHYIKPLQTGYPEDSDERFVKEFNPNVLGETLVTYKEPLSPHVCAINENRIVPDNEITAAVKKSILERQLRTGRMSGTSFGLVEMAGGVHSPGPSGTLQSDLYRPLRLPTIMVGDHRLGGISTTVSSFESMHGRGYDMNCVISFKGNHENAMAVQKNLPQEVPVFEVPDAPAPVQDTAKDRENLEQWFKKTESVFDGIYVHLKNSHFYRFDNLNTIEERTKDAIWWPFTQHKTTKTVTVIDSAHGDSFSVFQKGGEVVPSQDDSAEFTPANDLFDACGSWWTQGVGHGNKDLMLAVANAAGRYGHVMFPENTHEPALILAENMLSGVGSGWAGKCFYSDNGSTATEVAMKMAFRKRLTDMTAVSTIYSKSAGIELEVIGLTDSYHGDTIGAMDACSPNVFNRSENWYKGRGLWFEPPLVSRKGGKWTVDIPKEISDKMGALDKIPSKDTSFKSRDDIYDLGRDTTSLALTYREHIRKVINENTSNAGRMFGALMIEPVLHGAGGMLFVDPLFQRQLVLECRDLNIPVIFDEIFAGFYRLGPETASSLLHVKPDIACYGKLLTGGLLPLAVTLASDDIYSVFFKESKADCLLHGHSYTAHPMGCMAAVKSLSMYKKISNYDPRQRALSEHWDGELMNEISNLSIVSNIRYMGTVLAVELEDHNKGYGSYISVEFVRKLRSLGIFARPLGNVIYIMTQPSTTKQETSLVTHKLLDVLTTGAASSSSDFTFDSSSAAAAAGENCRIP